MYIVVISQNGCSALCYYVFFLIGICKITGFPWLFHCNLWYYSFLFFFCYNTRLHWGKRYVGNVVALVAKVYSRLNWGANGWTPKSRLSPIQNDHNVEVVGKEFASNSLKWRGSVLLRAQNSLVLALTQLLLLFCNFLFSPFFQM